MSQLPGRAATLSRVTRTLLAPELPDAEALGIESFDALFEPVPELDRAVELARGPSGCRRWRFALPGTPGPDGRLTGPPKGAGTGWVELWRWDGLGQRIRGENAWNLLCHLRGQGVATAMPLFVGSRGLLRQSAAVVVRELEGFRGWLEDWREASSAEERELLESALEAFLRRLSRAGVNANGLCLDHVRAAPAHVDEQASDEGDTIDCAAKAIASLRETRAQHSWRKNRMPTLALSDIDGFSLGAFSSEARESAATRIVRSMDGASPELTARIRQALTLE